MGIGQEADVAPGGHHRGLVARNRVLDGWIGGPQGPEGLGQIEEVIAPIASLVGGQGLADELADREGDQARHLFLRHRVEGHVSGSQDVTDEVGIPVTGHRPATSHVVHAQAQGVGDEGLVTNDG